MTGKEKFKLYPYQNLSLRDIKGEQWKPFPGYEGMYEVSDFGRVKSIRREIITGRGGAVILPERIRKQHLYIKRASSGQLSYNLKVGVTSDGQQTIVSVSRAVYCAFVRKIDIKAHNHKLIMKYKDVDGRNIHLSNLELVDKSSLLMLSLHKNSFAKKLTQFDVTGKPIMVFNSIMEASQKTGLSGSSLYNVLNERYSLLGGCFWKEGHHKKNFDFNHFRPAKKESLNESLIKKLNLKNIDPNNPPAFLNLSLESTKGEKWTDIPNFEGLYQISNYGRIKALKKVSGRERLRWYPEKIHRLSLAKTNQKEVHGRSLVAALNKNQMQYTISVARYVYYLFVKKFDLSDLTQRVYYIDGNPLNPHHKNLELKESGWSFVKRK